MATTYLNAPRLTIANDQMDRVFIKPIFVDNPVFSDDFMVDTNAIVDKHVPFGDMVQDVLRQYSNCNIQEVEVGTITERVWKTYSQAFRIPMCADEFQNLIFQGALKRGVEIDDLRGTQVQDIFMEYAMIAIEKDINNVAYFGKRAANPANITARKALSVANGFWSVHVPDMQANFSDFRYTSQNTALSTAGDAEDLLRSVYDNQSNELVAIPDTDKKFRVSRDVFEAYRRDLEVTQGQGGFTQYVENGKPQLSFRGIRVEPYYQWESTLNAIGANDATNGANLVLLTTKQNMWIGTDTSDAKSELEMWYERKDRKNYLDCAFKLGFDYVHESLFSVAANDEVITNLKTL